MSTVAQQPSREQSRTGDAPLKEMFGTRYALGMRHVYVTAAFAVFFVFLSYQPLFHTDLWGHVAYGDYLLSNNLELPKEDPFLKLGAGVPIVDTMWLSQILLAAADRAVGPELLCGIFALSVLLIYVVAAVTYYLQSGRVGAALIGAVLMFLVVGWNRHMIIRPEMFGSLGFGIAILICSRFQAHADNDSGAKWSLRAESKLWWAWLAIPILFAVWANLHGSYICGLAAIGCYLVGRVIEVGYKKQDANAVLADVWVRRWLVLLEVAVAATLINPYGIDLLLHNLFFAGQENLKDVTEWDPLVIASPAGYGFGLILVLLGVALHFSRIRVRPADMVLLAVFTVAALLHVRMLNWFAPVAVLALMPHLGFFYNKWVPYKELTYVNPVEDSDIPLSMRQSYTLTFCCICVAGFAFIISSVYYPIVYHGQRNPKHLYSAQTPRDLTAYLRTNRPEGQIWNTQTWGDWILWDGHAEGTPPLTIFADTNIHVLPPKVWRDYMTVLAAGNNWQGILDRYHVNTVIVEKPEQKQLTRAIRNARQWQVAYEDDIALVCTRMPPQEIKTEQRDLPKLPVEVETPAIP